MSPPSRRHPHLFVHDDPIVRSPSTLASVEDCVSERVAVRTLIVAGDVTPAVKLGAALAAQGHDVAFAGVPSEVDEIRRAVERHVSNDATVAVDAIGLARKVPDELAAVSARWTRVDMILVVSRLDARVAGLLDQSGPELQRALDEGSWPLVGAIHATQRVFTAGPRHAVAISRDDLQRFDADAAYRSVAAGVLETFVRYMATHLRPQGVLVNALRLPAQGNTAPDSNAVADVLVAIGTGLLDAMSGQVVTVDGGLGLRRGIGVTEVR
ncbi:MAG: SDR family oxidoreductase [Myxococcales bacterium FL481]|nr:MAG: SDR family oxidoreductase [Myxococcales bacterium FL481]